MGKFRHCDSIDEERLHRDCPSVKDGPRAFQSMHTSTLILSPCKAIVKDFLMGDEADPKAEDIVNGRSVIHTQN